MPVQAQFVHGCLYMRPLAVGEKPGSTPKAPPPAFVMKLIARVRRRGAPRLPSRPQRRWRREVDQWFDRDRSVQLAENLARQAVEPGDLDDVELAAHLASAVALRAIGAVGIWRRTAATWCPPATCWHCEQWGSAPTRRQVCSPVARRRRSKQRSCSARWRARSGAAGVPVASLETVDDVRALGPDARAAVDAWLQQHMWRTVTSDDVDRATLAEVPALQLAALLGATENLDVAEPDVCSRSCPRPR